MSITKQIYTTVLIGIGVTFTAFGYHDFAYHLSWRPALEALIGISLLLSGLDIRYKKGDL